MMINSFIRNPYVFSLINELFSLVYLFILVNLNGLDGKVYIMDILEYFIHENTINEYT
jgi:hypothetical protein